MFSIRFEVLKNSPNYRKKGNYKIYICLNYKWNSHWNTVNVGTRFLRQWSSIHYFLFQQANEVKSSMTWGSRDVGTFFAFLKAAGLTIPMFISNRHQSIAKWIREQEPATKHFFLWHVAKSVSKRLPQVGKESGCELLWSGQGPKKPSALVCYLHQAWI